MIDGRIQILTYAEVKKLKVSDSFVGVYRRYYNTPREQTLRIFEIMDDSDDLLVRVGRGFDRKFEFLRMSGWTVVSYARARGYDWVGR